MFTKRGTKICEARKILEYINGASCLLSRPPRDWGTDKGKINFLTGKVLSIIAEVAEPLTEEQAMQALKEYYENAGR